MALRAGYKLKDTGGLGGITGLVKIPEGSFYPAIQGHFHIANTNMIDLISQTKYKKIMKICEKKIGDG